MGERRVEVRSDVTEDAFLGGKLMLRQPAKGFRAGTDAVLLAAVVGEGAALSGTGLCLLDAGAGVGTAGLCAAVRLPGIKVTLVEREPVYVALARENVVANGLSDRVEVVEADIGAPPRVLAGRGLGSETFDVAIANPPYLEEGRHRLPVDRAAAAAFGMAPGGLDAWVAFLTRMVRPGGEIVLIHRADGLAQVLGALPDKLGAVRVLPVLPRAGQPAHRIIVRAQKGSRAPLTLLAGVALHGSGNAFLPEIGAVMREGSALRVCGGNR